MKKFIVINILLLWAVLTASWLFPNAKAGVSCSVPFNLTNGTTADATQVMANYNAILSCLANDTAASGVNSDITQLAALTTPLTAAQGGTTTYFAGTSTGTNTLTATASPTGFSLTAGRQVIFVAGGANTTSVVLNVSGSGFVAIERESPFGPTPLTGGEIIAGQVVQVVYDGSVFQMISAPADPGLPGAIYDYASANGCPAGYLPTDHAAYSQYAYLGNILGTTWGVSAGFTVMPDLRGRTTFDIDSTGTRITVAGGNFDGSAVGNTGGQQNSTIGQTNLPNNISYTPSGTVSMTSPATPLVGSGSISASLTAGGSSLPSPAASPGLTFSGMTNGDILGGSNTPLPVLSNAAIVLKCIKT